MSEKILFDRWNRSEKSINELGTQCGHDYIAVLLSFFFFSTGLMTEKIKVNLGVIENRTPAEGTDPRGCSYVCPQSSPNREDTTLGPNPKL